MQVQLISNQPFSKLHFLFDQGCNAVADCLNNKVTQVFLAALAGGLLALGLATLASLSLPMSIAVVASASVIGGGIPLLIDWIWKRPVVYQELEQIATTYAESPQMLQTIDKVRQFLTPSHIQLQQSYDYHHFHHDLTAVTEQVKTRDDLREIWRTFLNRIEGRSIFQPDGISQILTAEMEKQRLDNRHIEIITDRLNLRSPLFEQELHQLNAIRHECFTGNTRETDAHFRTHIQNANVQIHIARQRDTQKILGYVSVQEEVDQQSRPTLHVMNVGRRAEACSLGIAQRIFAQVFAQPMDRYTSVFLEVRESNADAIALYERWGFARTGRHNNYYSYPTENALIMRRHHLIA